MSVYFPPDHPRWSPKTEAEIQSAIDDGLLEESHFLDLKREVVTKGDNRETARDLASFAIDSGLLIIGVAEDKENRTFSLAPQPLSGLAEKIENVAHTIPDPPLSVVTHPIRSETDPSRGYLVVHVPASPAAPHMVDGRYLGRGDKTKRTLPDAEVLRLHQRRRIMESDTLALLQQEIDKDPIPAEIREQAHLFLIAQPMAGRSDMLLDMVTRRDWQEHLFRFTERADAPELQALLQGIPGLENAHRPWRQSRGIARTSTNITSARGFEPGARESAIEVQVHQDGGLRLFSSRLSRGLDGRGKGVVDAIAVGLTRRFLALIVAAAEEGSYFGNWAIGFGATGLQGMPAISDRAVIDEDSPRYHEDTYMEATAATWADLTTKPGAITRQLVGRLLRAFDLERVWEHVLTDPVDSRAGAAGLHLVVLLGRGAECGHS
ncbi:AlbA family DNA-binding domain-containing protein [Streptomyces sp. 7N604]|uniref:AlbA family DNA-binding domain-containing protein n=1 Tax=Streptomyces sp. 7N604 TaxID=3457415 RepID=UPI003FD0EC31